METLAKVLLGLCGTFIVGGIVYILYFGVGL